MSAGNGRLRIIIVFVLVFLDLILFCVTDEVILSFIVREMRLSTTSQFVAVVVTATGMRRLTRRTLGVVIVHARPLLLRLLWLCS